MRFDKHYAYLSEMCKYMKIKSINLKISIYFDHNSWNILGYSWDIVIYTYMHAHRERERVCVLYPILSWETEK